MLDVVVGIQDFYGRGLKVIAWYSIDEERSRITQLISRITNAEAMTRVRWALPKSRANRLTVTDVAIIRALSDDARLPLTQVAKGLGLSTRSVRNHVEKLRSENVIHALPTLNMGAISGLIPVHISYSYSRSELKGAVDSAMRSHFEERYLSVMFSDPDGGYILLVASTMNDVRDYLEWTKSRAGVASARADILVRWLTFPDKLLDLLIPGDRSGAPQKEPPLRVRRV